MPISFFWPDLWGCDLEANYLRDWQNMEANWLQVGSGQNEVFLGLKVLEICSLSQQRWADSRVITTAVSLPAGLWTGARNSNRWFMKHYSSRMLSDSVRFLIFLSECISCQLNEWILLFTTNHLDRHREESRARVHCFACWAYFLKYSCFIISAMILAVLR